MARVALNAAAAVGCLLLITFGAVAAAATDDLGGGNYGRPNASVCPTPHDSLEASCTVLQLRRGYGNPFAGKFKAHSDGVITKWWVNSGPPSPATSAVHLRLRLFDGFDPIPGAQTRLRRLPIKRPGMHKFLARLPIKRGQQIALDVAVLGSRGGGPAAAPIARSVRDIREVAAWTPVLGLGPRRPNHLLRNTKLQLAAQVEPDFDEDDWGDSTQDGCRFDPRRHSACLPDRAKPSIRISFARRQDFIAKRKLFVRIQTSEYGRVFASGLLMVGGAANALLGSAAWLPAGGSANFPVYINDFSLRAAKHAIAKGGHPFVSVTVEVTDASGNRVRREVEVRWKEG
jgi:hypothetical protein